MHFVNLTPHDITIVQDGDVVATIPKSGNVARCATERNVVGTISVDGVEIPMTEVVLGEVAGLPEPNEGTAYIVSLAVATRASQDGRVDDIFVPDDTVRDEDGRIIGCQALARQPA